MRASFRQSKYNSEQWRRFRVSDSSEWWTLQLCSRQRRYLVLSTRENPEGCRDGTGAVRGDEPAVQKRMPTIKKIPKTVEITHAVGQGQVPNIAKKLTRYRRRSSCRCDARQTIPRHPGDPDGRSSAVQHENEVVDMPVVMGRRARFRRAGCSDVVQHLQSRCLETKEEGHCQSSVISAHHVPPSSIFQTTKHVTSLGHTHQEPLLSNGVPSARSSRHHRANVR